MIKWRARHSLLLFWRKRLAFTQFSHSFERIGDFIDFTRSHTLGVLGVAFPMIARDFNVFDQKAQQFGNVGLINQLPNSDISGLIDRNQNCCAFLKV